MKWFLATLIILGLGLSACTNQPTAQSTMPADPADLAYCQQLAANYDRYVPRSQGAPTTGALDRQIGEQQCSHGQTQDGIERLQRANSTIGFPNVSR